MDVNPLYTWAQKWGVTAEAVDDLHQVIGLALPAALAEDDERTEADVSARRRLDAAQQRWPLWRNNSGACESVDGRQIRYGLANDSEKINEKIKSSDLIGCRPVRITPEMVGTVIGQFVAVETKAPGWRYMATDRERAQRTFIELVLSLGGYAKFDSGEGPL